MSARDVRRHQNVAAHAVNASARLRQFVDAVAEFERDQAAFGAGAHAFDERRDDAGPGAPGDVETRHRIAVPDGVAAAALGPADDRKEADAAFAQPRAFLAGGEGDVSLRPLPRPEILLAVERGGAEPILERQRVRVANAHAALLGGIDQENSAERPERLAAERLLRLLIEHDDLASGVDQLGGGDEPGEARSYDDHVGVIGHIAVPS